MEHPVVKKPLSTPKSTIEFNKPYGTPCSIGPLSTPRRGQDPHERKCNSYRSPHNIKPKKCTKGKQDPQEDRTSYGSPHSIKPKNAPRGSKIHRKIALL